MKNLFELVKVSLRETLDVRKFKENKAKTTSFLVFVLLMGAFFTFLSFIYNFSIVQIFHEANAPLIDSTLMMGGLATLMVFTTAIVRAKSIFVSKDYEMLRSMPIKKRDIVFSKIINMYLIELIYSSIIMIPNGIVCFMTSGNVFYLLSGIAVAILIPGLPIIVGCIFGLFVALVADRSKFGNVFTILLYIIFFVAIFAFSFMSGMSGGEGDLSEITELYSTLGYLNPTMFFVRAAFMVNPMYYILFVVSNGAALAIAVAFIALLFDKIYELSNSKKSSNKYVAAKLKNKGQFKALFAHEIKRYFSSKLYCINTIISGVVSVIMVAGVSFAMHKMLLSSEEVAVLKDYIYIGSFFIIFAIGISTPASVSISIEGANFWLVKTLPINYKTLVRVKILMSSLILGVFSLISSLIIAIVFQPGIFDTIVIFLAPLLYLIGASGLGLFINLNFYKLKWTNEAEVVKNSSAVIISMLADMGICIAFGAAAIVPGIFVSPYAGMAMLLILSVVFAALFYYIPVSSAEFKIRKIEDF